MKTNLFLSFAMLASLSFAKTVDLSKSQNTLEFLAIGRPSAIKIKGTVKEDVPDPLTGELKLEKSKLNVNATFKMNAWDSGVELRNTHMREKYLECEKFPEAKLVVKDQDLKSGVKGPFKGNLTLHGVTKELTGEALVTESEGTLDCEFSFSINVQDYGIEIPSYLGIKVTDAVKVETKIKAQ